MTTHFEDNECWNVIIPPEECTCSLYTVTFTVLLNLTIVIHYFFVTISVFILDRHCIPHSRLLHYTQHASNHLVHHYWLS